MEIREEIADVNGALLPLSTTSVLFQLHRHNKQTKQFNNFIWTQRRITVKLN